MFRAIPINGTLEPLKTPKQLNTDLSTFLKFKQCNIMIHIHI